MLNQWLLGLFDVARLEELADRLKAPEAEGYTDDNTTRFVDLVAGLPSRHALLNRDTLRGYDENIVCHWKRIGERRERIGGTTLVLKYFLYLGLLFTEIYLDRFFSDFEGLRDALNAQVDHFNAEQSEANQVDHYVDDDLRKVAFWQATGSGKALLMHINILQYQHYLAKHGRAHELNRISCSPPTRVCRGSTRKNSIVRIWKPVIPQRRRPAIHKPVDRDH